jgi:S1-C subfamily serine protease
LDLAVLVIDTGDIPPVSFRDGAAGAAIGIAGYPSFRFEGVRSLGEVEPSVHFGAVNGFTGRFYYARRFLEFDALTDHGNSGGPLFGVNSGNVYVVVTLGIPSHTSSRVQNNLAISSEVAQEFLAYSYVPYYYYSHSTANASPVVSAVPCRAQWRDGYPYEEFKSLQRKFCALPDAVN